MNFGMKKELVEHIIQHHFGCKTWLMSFPKQKDLDDHITEQHVFVCGICQHISPTPEELDVHMDRKHDPTLEKRSARHPEDEELVRRWREKMVAKEKQLEKERERHVRRQA